jgi:hypothetical protein
MITVRLDIPTEFRNRAKYVFENFALHWGIPTRFVNDDERADVVYSSQSEPDDNGQSVISFDPAMYRPETGCQLHQREGKYLWTRSTDKGGISDVVAGGYRLLSLLDESQIGDDKRDRRGNFLSQSLPPDRRRIAQEPIFENHADWVLNLAMARRPQLKQQRISRWPGRKAYAISLTHDVDAVRLGAPLELASNLLKAVLRRDGIRFKMFKAGLHYFNKPLADPNFAFPLWRTWESASQLRSAFYLFLRPHGARADINDSKSSIYRQPVSWPVLRRMSESGWEFGLHASIRAKDEYDTFTNAKQWIEEKLGTSVFGLRHHYWAINWNAPHLTFRKHVNAGFRYDSSLAWRDIPGFRTGCCLPYAPFDPGRDRPFALFELPTCLMDGHLVFNNIASGELNGNRHTAVETGRQVLQTVRRHGGLAVLDWHQEAAMNALVYNGHLDLLIDIVEPFLKDENAWWATPKEICQHWHHRRRSILGED